MMGEILVREGLPRVGGDRPHPDDYAERDERVTPRGRG